eukprot:2803088-Rhodomonas_salina.1
MPEIHLIVCKPAVEPPRKALACICMLCDVSNQHAMCCASQAISKRSVEEFKAILSRVPTLSAALLHKTLKARFGVEAS